MRRKAAALLFCIALLFQLAAVPAGAAQTVFFTAVEGEVLPLSDETMPFWTGGYLYIPSTMFTGTVRESLDISYISNTSKNLAILYKSGQPLRFEVGKPYGQDADGNTYFPGAVQRGGVIFVPAAVVANYFNLLYDPITVRYGTLVWLRKPGSGFTKETFADAATYRMEENYADYLKAREQSQDTQEGMDGEDGADDGEAAAFSGKGVYLCFSASDPLLVGELLDTLDRYGGQAAFYCTVDFLEQQDDLLRRMAATGQAIGVLADAADTERSPEEQLEAGNAALAQATCGKTRLAYLQNADAAVVQQVEAAGYRCLEADLDRSVYGLWGVTSAETLLQRVNARRGGVSVWLGDQVGAGGLRAFLSAAAGTEDTCLAVTETA